MSTRRLGLVVSMAILGVDALWVASKGRAALWTPELAVQFGLVFLGLLGLLASVSTSARAATFVRRAVGEATAESLGAMRILVCGVLLLTVVTERLASVAALPPEMRWGMGLMRLFYLLPLGFDHLVRSEIGLTLFQTLTALLLVLGLVGWRTRVVLPLAAVAYYAMFGILRQYSFFWHQGLVPLYALAVLSVTPCGDALSVDRRRRLARGEPVPTADEPTARYGWARYAVWVVVALTYTAAGLSKLRDGGLFWGNPTNMRAILYGDSFDPMHQFDWGLSPRLAEAPDLLFTLLGLSGMYGELLYGLVLVSRRARYVLPPAMAGMHLGILFLQNILFFDLILLQLVFVDFTAVRRRMASWLARRPAAPIPAAAVPAATTPAGRPAWPAGWGLVGPARVAVLAAGMLSVWLYRIEFYPFTAVQMYARPVTTVTYVKALARRESGVASRAYFEQALARVAPGIRYRHVIRQCFMPTRAEVCERFLTAIGTGYNQTARPGERVTEFDIQKWTWDHRAHPDDHNYGTITEQRVVPVPSAAVARPVPAFSPRSAAGH